MSDDRRPRPTPADRPDGDERPRLGRFAVFRAAVVVARARRRPGDGTRGPTMTAFEVVAIGALGLLFAMLFNAGALRADAERLPFGPSRDRALVVWEPIDNVADALQITFPRRELDNALGRDDTGPGVHADGEGSDDATTASSADDAEGASGAAASTTAPPPPTTRSHVDGTPFVTYVGGDSLMQELGIALVRAADTSGDFVSTLDYRINSGLTRPDYFDWPAHLAGVIDELDPEIMVVTFGANDSQGIVTPAGDVFQIDDEDGWDAEYRRRVAEVMDLMTARGGRVYWVGQPPMRDAGFAARMAHLNGIYAEEAAENPLVTFIDATPVLGDAAGRFQDIVQIDGEVLDLRQEDGIHLGLDGADLLADAVLDRLRQDVGLGDG
ncbi:MAG: DUF459 domain-containing protein [Acidimicrobiales bacterium]